MLELNYVKAKKEKVNKCGGIVTFMDEWTKLIGSTELARVVADITGDGHLQLKDWRGLVSFYSNDIKTINNLKSKFNKLFGVKGHVYIDNRASMGNKVHRRYKLFFISKPLALFFEKIGVPSGNKTNSIFDVPSWVLHGHKKVKVEYLKGFFTAEGYIYPTKSKNSDVRWRIGIEQYKNEKIKESGKIFMEQLRTMLKDFKIKSSPTRFNGSNTRKDGTKTIGIRFDIEKSNFGNFYKYIGFDHTEKQRKLLFSMRGH